jgi:hypothetical protein
VFPEPKVPTAGKLVLARITLPLDNSAVLVVGRFDNVNDHPLIVPKVAVEPVRVIPAIVGEFTLVNV